MYFKQFNTKYVAHNIWTFQKLWGYVRYVTFGLYGLDLHPGEARWRTLGIALVYSIYIYIETANYELDIFTFAGLAEG